VNTVDVWEVSGTDEFAAWYGSLDAKDQSKVDERIELLAASGPALRRPVVLHAEEVLLKEAGERRTVF
jgi:hypothetical protein